MRLPASPEPPPSPMPWRLPASRSASPAPPVVKPPTCCVTALWTLRSPCSTTMIPSPTNPARRRPSSAKVSSPSLPNCPPRRCWPTPHATMATSSTTFTRTTATATRRRRRPTASCTSTTTTPPTPRPAPPVRADFLALLGMRPDPRTLIYTGYVDGRDVLPFLTPQQQALLRQPLFCTPYDEYSRDSNSLQVDSKPHIVLKESHCFRYYETRTKPLPDAPREAFDAMLAFKDALVRAKKERVRIGVGELFSFPNQAGLHNREIVELCDPAQAAGCAGCSRPTASAAPSTCAASRARFPPAWTASSTTPSNRPTRPDYRPTNERRDR